MLIPFIVAAILPQTNQLSQMEFLDVFPIGATYKPAALKADGQSSYELTYGLPVPGSSSPFCAYAVNEATCCQGFGTGTIGNGPLIFVCVQVTGGCGNFDPAVFNIHNNVPYDISVISINEDTSPCDPSHSFEVSDDLDFLSRTAQDVAEYGLSTAVPSATNQCGANNILCGAPLAVTNDQSTSFRFYYPAEHPTTASAVLDACQTNLAGTDVLPTNIQYCHPDATPSCTCRPTTWSQSLQDAHDAATDFTASLAGQCYFEDTDNGNCALLSEASFCDGVPHQCESIPAYNMFANNLLQAATETFWIGMESETTISISSAGVATSSTTNDYGLACDAATGVLRNCKAETIDGDLVKSTCTELPSDGTELCGLQTDFEGKQITLLSYAEAPHGCSVTYSRVTDGADVNPSAGYAVTISDVCETETTKHTCHYEAAHCVLSTPAPGTTTILFLDNPEQMDCPEGYEACVSPSDDAAGSDDGAQGSDDANPPAFVYCTCTEYSTSLQAILATDPTENPGIDQCSDGTCASTGDCAAISKQGCNVIPSKKITENPFLTGVTVPTSTLNNNPKFKISTVGTSIVPNTDGCDAYLQTEMIECNSLGNCFKTEENSFGVCIPDNFQVYKIDLPANCEYDLTMAADGQRSITATELCTTSDSDPFCNFGCWNDDTNTLDMTVPSTGCTTTNPYCYQPPPPPPSIHCDCTFSDALQAVLEDPDSETPEIKKCTGGAVSTLYKCLLASETCETDEDSPSADFLRCSTIKFGQLSADPFNLDNEYSADVILAQGDAQTIETLGSDKCSASVGEFIDCTQTNGISFCFTPEYHAESSDFCVPSDYRTRFNDYDPACIKEFQYDKTSLNTDVRKIKFYDACPSSQINPACDISCFDSSGSYLIMKTSTASCSAISKFQNVYCPFSLLDFSVSVHNEWNIDTNGGSTPIPDSAYDVCAGSTDFTRFCSPGLRQCTTDPLPDSVYCAFPSASFWFSPAFIPSNPEIINYEFNIFNETYDGLPAIRGKKTENGQITPFFSEPCDFSTSEYTCCTNTADSTLCVAPPAGQACASTCTSSSKFDCFESVFKECTANAVNTESWELSQKIPEIRKLEANVCDFVIGDEFSAFCYVDVDPQDTLGSLIKDLPRNTFYFWQTAAKDCPTNNENSIEYTELSIKLCQLPDDYEWASAVTSILDSRDHFEDEQIRADTAGEITTAFTNSLAKLAPDLNVKQSDFAGSRWIDSILRRIPPGQGRVVVINTEFKTPARRARRAAPEGCGDPIPVPTNPDTTNLPLERSVAFTTDAYLCPCPDPAEDEGDSLCYRMAAVTNGGDGTNSGGGGGGSDSGGDSLSDGAIAGIIVGSLAGVGLVGFSVFKLFPSAFSGSTSPTTAAADPTESVPLRLATGGRMFV